MRPLVRWMLRWMGIASMVALTLQTSFAGEKPEGAKWGDLFVDAILKKWPEPDSIANKGWEYENSIVLHGMEKVYQRNGDKRVVDYIRKFVDGHVAADGTVAMKAEEKNLDRIQPGMLLLFLYQETHEAHYKDAATHVIEALQTYPRNRLGAYWHKGSYPNEVWADGIYMAEPFVVKYASLTGEHTLGYGDAFTQFAIANDKTTDPRTGLLFHAWDADGNAAWADKETGHSPHIWSRGMGWYAMALVDVLEYLPADHPFRRDLQAILKRVGEGLRKTQAADGTWSQVVEAPERKGNWPEMSGTAMFVYALHKAVRLGLIDAAYRDVADKGWKGMQPYLNVVNGVPEISQVVRGMGVQISFENYVKQSRLVNSPHGLCAILFAASEMEY